MKVNNKYEVEWKDTFSQNGWWDKEDLFKEAERCDYYIKSVGYYVGEQSGYIIIASSLSTLSDDRPYGYIKFIPKGAVKTTKYISK